MRATARETCVGSMRSELVSARHSLTYGLPGRLEPVVNTEPTLFHEQCYAIRASITCRTGSILCRSAAGPASSPMPALSISRGPTGFRYSIHGQIARKISGLVNGTSLPFYRAASIDLLRTANSDWSMPAASAAASTPLSFSGCRGGCSRSLPTRCRWIFRRLAAPASAHLSR